MLIQIGLTVVGCLAIGVLAVMQMSALHQDFGSVALGYHQLRQVYEAGTRLALARETLLQPAGNTVRAAESIRFAALTLEMPPQTDTAAPPGLWIDQARQTACAAQLREAGRQLARHEPVAADARAGALASINSVTADLAGLSAQVRRSILASQQAADRKQRQTLTLVIVYGCLLTALAVLAGVWHYRSVSRPLARLGQGARDFAAGRFDTRIPVVGDREFAALAAEFNHMAQELETLYRDLEQKVQTTSHELVQSERLASVGYLAAGVAHEINNPLGIISGYSERTLRLLDRQLDPATLPRLREAAGIIRDEAFRCKDITDRLLSLARPGQTDRKPVSLDAIVRDVIASLAGLPDYAHRPMTLEATPGADLAILAREGEIKQVVLNLLLNALDAVGPAGGQVHIAIWRDRDTVVLCVQDDGLGMSPETLGRVFEPFFSQKTSQQVGQTTGRRGTGLGLSITHAIVREHDGQIHAQSDGPGKGSRFTVELPAATQGTASDNH